MDSDHTVQQKLIDLKVTILFVKSKITSGTEVTDEEEKELLDTTKSLTISIQNELHDFYGCDGADPFCIDAWRTLEDAFKCLKERYTGDWENINALIAMRGHIFEDLGHFEAAGQLYNEVIESAERSGRNDSRIALFTKYRSVRLSAKAAISEENTEMLLKCSKNLESIASMQEAFGADDPDRLHTLCFRGDVLHMMGNDTESLRILEEVAEISKRPSDDSFTLSLEYLIEEVRDGRESNTLVTEWRPTG
jgi:tetratricopeptide (TPR) repeat protein